jgi:hypothetical protein
MSPRSWFCLSLLLLELLAACQPIRPIDVTPANPPVAAVPSTSTTGASDCPLLGDQPLDLIIAPNWQEGDTRRYKATYSRTVIKGGEEDPTLTTSYAMAVVVLQAPVNGFVLEWNSIAMVPNPRKIRLEYTTTLYGEFDELRNLEELQDLIEPLSPEQGVLLLDPEQASTLITNDVRDFHAVFGLYFTKPKPFWFDESATLTPYDISGINRVHIELLRYDPEIGCLHLLTQTEWHPLPLQRGGDVTAHSTILYNLDLNTGWLQSIDIERTFIVDGNGRIEELHLTYVPPAE